MSYPDSDNKKIFLRQYLDAIASADFPAIQEVRSLVTAILEKPNLPPNNPMLWPLHTFISKALEQQAPRDWLTDPPFAEQLTAIRQILDFLELKSQGGLLKVQDLEGKPIPTHPVMDRAFLRSVAATLLRSFPYLASEDHRNSALQTIDRIEITLHDGRIAKLVAVSTAEYLERARIMLRQWIMRMENQGDLRYETTDDIPFGQSVENARIPDNLTDLIIDELETNSIHNLSVIDHVHVTLSGQKAVGVKLCHKVKVVEHIQRERILCHKVKVVEHIQRERIWKH